jgi:hypothetical protein
MVHRILAAGLGACGVALGVAAASGSEKADLKKDIDRAIQRGVIYLKKHQTKQGSWPVGNQSDKQATPPNQLDGSEWVLGATALAGLTLLECGTPAKDLVVQKAAAFVRTGSIPATGTYSLSLSIMFLDRLGEAADIPLLESMTVRLLAGQDPAGGWTYYCPEISKEEKRRLAKVIEQRDEWVRKGGVPKKREAKLRTVKDLPKEITSQLMQISRHAGSAGNRDSGGGDNSNTQFAILALWISHRLGFPVHDALRRTDWHFRGSQENNGGWGYYSGFEGRGVKLRITTATMTCAGLLGLGLGHGAATLKTKEKNPKAGPATNPDKDRAIKKGLVALGTTIGEPTGGKWDKVPLFRDKGQKGGRTYYYLWSLERVAMAYGLDRIGTKDWYSWGAEILVANQGDDGSWIGSYYEGNADTCFALLFLGRSNLAPDLTAFLKGRIKKAGETALTAGGVGGDKLVQGELGKGLKTGIGAQPDPADRREGAGTSKKPRVIQASPEEQDRQITRLSNEFVRASGDDQEKLLAKLKESKGVVYTEALAGSIPLLKGAMKARARDALAGRLTRMSVDTLRDKLKDECLEIRRAAALACARKKSRAHIPDLIALLEDSELPVALAAHQALKDLTGQDFGPEADATRAERKEAVAQWKAWWKKRNE